MTHERLRELLRQAQKSFIILLLMTSGQQFQITTHCSHGRVYDHTKIVLIGSSQYIELYLRFKK